MPRLIFEDILIDERVFVLSGNFERGRGVVCGKTPTMVRAQFDKHTAGEMKACVYASMLYHIYVPPAARSEGKPAAKAAPATERKTTPIDEKELRMIFPNYKG